MTQRMATKLCYNYELRGVVAAPAGQAMALPLLPVKEQKKKKKENLRIIKHGYGT